jgi:hypothetical protein
LKQASKATGMDASLACFAAAYWLPEQVTIIMAVED